MLIKDSAYFEKYRVGPIKDDGSDIIFRYHFPTTMFGSNLRITSLEIRDFILPHLLACIGQQVIPSSNMRIVQELSTVMRLLIDLPDHELDKIHDWIWVEQRDERKGYARVSVENAPDNVVVHISLRGQNPHVKHRPTGLVPDNIR